MYTLQCHAGSVTAAAFNKDDDYFASGGMDKQVRGGRSGELRSGGKTAYGTFIYKGSEHVIY